MVGKKVLTIKNLNAIWKVFTQHSSSSTVLLDDSPGKAQLQPWNHIVLNEYTQQTRAQDLKVWNHHRLLDPPPSSEKKHKKKEAKRAAKIDVHVDSVTNPIYHLTPENVLGSHSTALDSEVASHQPESAPGSLLYDETILGVIGILEALKTHSNVAHWLRSGGLGLNNPNNPSTLETNPSYWFHDTVAVQGWVEKGRLTLEALGIDLEAGVRG